MSMSLGLVPPVIPPEGLAISEAGDIVEFVHAYARVSGIAAEALAAAVASERQAAGDGTVTRLAGRSPDGSIVATTVLWIFHGVAVLYFVGTAPDQRRRGVGTAMTTAALALARDRGIRTAAVISTSMGEPMYRRIGFREVAHYRLLSF
jgi:GNAT superfamily N-acetyltransferase